MFSAAARRDAGPCAARPAGSHPECRRDGGHCALDDAELIVEHFGQLCKVPVVHDALEMMCSGCRHTCRLNSQMSSSAAQITFLAPASCTLALAAR